MESIRPILPTIRHTPYGRRIAGKIQERDDRLVSEDLTGGEIDMPIYQSAAPAQYYNPMNGPSRGVYGSAALGTSSTTMPTIRRNQRSGNDAYVHQYFNGQTLQPQPSRAGPFQANFGSYY